MQADGEAKETAYEVTLARALTNHQLEIQAEANREATSYETAYAVTLARALTNYQSEAKGEGTANAMTYARAHTKYQSEVQMEAMAPQKPPKTRKKRENNWESKSKAQDLKPRK